MARSRFPLVFGQGLDRGSGVMASQPASFLDLRNVYLYDGKAQARRGASIWANLAGENAIIHIHPVRSQNVGAAVTYNATTRQVNLYRIALGDTDRMALVGTLWTLPVGTSFPRVHATDSYGKLYIAHDEVEYNNSRRQITRIYDPGAATIADLTADLFAPTDPPTPVGVRFRGVTRYLNYIFGWGYGSEQDPDQQHIVRVSLPDKPSVFDPKHYFNVGQRGEAVEVVIPAGNTLLAMKQNETYEITGYDRSTFGIRLVDPLYGVMAGKLAINVGGTVYFWSNEGPRMTTGGPSIDLAVPLDLGGPSPSALADSAALKYGFATYLPERREVLFVFGKWAYCLSVRDPQAMRWSYREFGIELASAGMIYPTEISTYVNPNPPPTPDPGGPPPTPTQPPPDPVVGPTSRPAPLAVVNDSPNLRMKLTWTNSGAVQTATTYEIWRRAPGGVWANVDNNTHTVAGASQTHYDDVPSYGTLYEYAVRFLHGGLYATGYTSADPSSWPADSRASGTSMAEPAPPPSPNLPTPTGLFVIRSGNNFSLAWDGNGAPAGTIWEVYEATSSGLLGSKVGQTSEEFYDGYTVNGYQYWKVRATKPGWNTSQFSNVVTAYGSDGGGPGHPPV